MNVQGEYKWMVCTRCMTFNHAPYIVDTMNGFAMQQTDFPFVCTIIDDCSTDGEQEIIRQYLRIHFDSEDKNMIRYEDTNDYQLCFARHKTNRNCYFAVLLLKYNHYNNKKNKLPYLKQWHDNAKYHAICEGDDYWTDSSKLQVQVDFLNSHLDYSAVATQSMIVNTSGEPIRLFSKNTQDQDWEVGQLIGARRFHTATILYRYYKELDDRPAVYSGDVSLIMLLSQKGKWRLMSRCASVYRKHPGGASSNVKISDLRRDMDGIPYYLKINPQFPQRRYKGYLYYTFSTFPPLNNLSEILKNGIVSIYYSLTCYPVDFHQAGKTVYYIFLKLKKKYILNKGKKSDI